MKRLFATTVLGVALAIIVASLGQAWLMRGLIRGEGETDLSAMRPPAGIVVQRLDAALGRGVSDPAELRELLEQHVHLAPPPRQRARARVMVHTASSRVYEVLTGHDGHTMIYVTAPELRRPLAVGPVEGSWSALNETKLALALALALTVAVLFSLPVTLPVARGLDKLRVAARRISEGDLGARADVKRGPARELARAFNAMADHNQRLLESQRHLLEAVSHELRTPTARIRFALEMLDTARDAADRERRLAAIDDDLAEIDDLVAELLTYTRLAGSPRDIEGDTITVADEIEELADYVRERRQRVEVTVVVPDAARDRVLEVEQRLFRRAVRNLMLNAARHAEGRVVVSVEPQPDGVLIAVCDDGPGVPEADRERIFEPFARSDDSRSRDSGGAGLGLAIVRRIMEVHGGTVRCLSCPELGGARFEVSWPT